MEERLFTLLAVLWALAALLSIVAVVGVWFCVADSFGLSREHGNSMVRTIFTAAGKVFFPDLGSQHRKNSESTRTSNPLTMKNQSFTCLLATSLLLVIGCSPMRYSQYTGEKRNWQTANGAMAETQYKVPVYRGWPDRPYNVIGSIRFVDRNKYWDDGVIDMACSMAKQKGADAIIIRYGAEYGVGMITGSGTDPQVVSVANDTTALAIKWKTQAELDAEKAAIARLIAQFKDQHRDLGVNKELFDLATEYVRSSGVNLGSDEASRQFEQTLTDVSAAPKSGQSRWLFRGSVRAGSLTASWSDTVYGVATITRTGDNVTIVSSSKGAELTFSGAVQDGRLTGQLGFTGGATILSAKADGVYTEERIALTGQGQTPDGTFQVSFTFVR